MTLTKRSHLKHFRDVGSGTQDSAAQSRFRRLSGAERLVGVGFRCWLAGYQTGIIDCWEMAWNAYAKELGPRVAKDAITELSCWVRAIHSNAVRGIEVFPANCAAFCQDECLAVSMVAAAQHSCPGVRACAFALLGSQQLDDVVASTTSFAGVLRDRDIVLAPELLAQPQLMEITGPSNQFH